jgi:hypothetical protein
VNMKHTCSTAYSNSGSHGFTIIFIGFLVVKS